MHSVYILQSPTDQRLYVGLTNDIERRIKEHNNGKVNATRNSMPLELLAQFTFNNRKKAEDFERYLKTGSGRAFISKRVL